MLRKDALIKTTMNEMYKDLQADVNDYNDNLNEAIGELEEATKWVKKCKTRLDEAVKDLDLYKKDHDLV